MRWWMVAIFVGKDVYLDRLGLNLPREAKPERITTSACQKTCPRGILLLQYEDY
jgi:hypothetical protein